MPIIIRTYARGKPRCMFLHSWIVGEIDHQSFLATDCCEKCSARRTRSLRPKDERDLVYHRALRDFSNERSRLLRQFCFEAQKGKSANHALMKRTMEKLRSLKRPKR